MGMSRGPTMGEGGTWLEAEEFCYPDGKMTRRCRARNARDNQLRIVRCGIPDTYFTIPATGGYISVNDGEFVFYPRQ